MRINNRQKKYWVWLLVGLFILPYMGKSMHIHHCVAECVAEHICPEEEEEHSPAHHCEDCPVCNFILCCFLPDEGFTETTVSLPSEVIQIPLGERIHTHISSPFYLRGPPRG